MAAQQMTKLTQLYHKVEKDWKEYQLPIHYFYDIFIWKRRLELSSLTLVFVPLLLWSIRHWFSIMRIFPTIILVFVYYFVYDLLKTILKIQIPWHKLVDYTCPEGEDPPLDPVYLHCVSLYSTYKFKFDTIFADLRHFRQLNPQKFVLQLFILGHILAFLFNQFSGFFLCFVLSYTILLLPGLLYHRIFQKGYTFLSPYIHHYVVMVLDSLSLLKSKVRASAPFKDTSTSKSPQPSAPSQEELESKKDQ